GEVEQAQGSRDGKPFGPSDGYSRAVVDQNEVSRERDRKRNRRSFAIVERLRSWIIEDRGRAHLEPGGRILDPGTYRCGCLRCAPTRRARSSEGTLFRKARAGCCFARSVCGNAAAQHQRRPNALASQAEPAQVLPLALQIIESVVNVHAAVFKKTIQGTACLEAQQTAQFRNGEMAQLVFLEREGFE